MEMRQCDGRSMGGLGWEGLVRCMHMLVLPDGIHRMAPGLFA